jgi:pimeloyl-ACP methyl ester carboxylesterase
MGANCWPDTSAIDPFFYNIFKMQYTMLQKRPNSTVTQVMQRHYKLIMTEPHISVAQLKKIQCPTLVVAGDHDAIRVQHTALIAQSIPNANLWIAPNAGHGLMVGQYKDKFNAEVDDFFKRKFVKIQGYDLFKN